MPCASQSFDVVYIRQAVHHAAELNTFIRESARLLKPGGVLMSARDHVIYNEMDKQWFLETHPLHRFYGGENAFTEQEYRLAIEGAGLDIVLCLHHYESVINYFPEKRDEVEGKLYERKKWIELAFLKKAPPPLNKISFLINLCYARIEKKLTPVFDERKIPGRTISFIAIKNA